jgi:uncharacterized membrane protein YecN with MAPEG domain
MKALHFPAAITVLTVALLLALSAIVIHARARHRVAPPATAGDPGFERALRTQANTVEAAIAFLPSLWLYALYQDPAWAAALGAVWLVGRIGYVVGYLAATPRRLPGFVVSTAAVVALALGAAAGVARALVAP